MDKTHRRRTGWHFVTIGVAAFLITANPASRSRAGKNSQRPTSVINPAAKALLDRAIQALGGPAFLGFETLTTRGRAFSITDGATSGFVQYQSAVKFPNQRRLSYGLGNKKTVTLINNGDQGWEIDRYGLIDQSDKQIHAWKLANRYSLENLLRLRIREPGTLIQNRGQDFVDNQPALVVDIVDSRQVDVKLYLHRETFLPIRVVYPLQNPQTHDWDEYADVYADYRQVQGIQTPMHLVRYLNGERIAETFRMQARYNETYAPNFFRIGSE